MTLTERKKEKASQSKKRSRISNDPLDPCARRSSRDLNMRHKSVLDWNGAQLSSFLKTLVEQ